MLQALAVVVPLGLAGAVSPVMLTEQTVLLAGPGGRRAGWRYAAGVVLTLVVVVAAAMLFGRSIRLPTRPHLDASLDVVLGLVLLAVAGTVRGVERRSATGPEGAPPSRERASHRANAAFPFGVFSMATNVTTLALLVPAVKEVSTAHTGAAGRVVLVLVLVSLASAPATAPLAATRIAPGPGQRALAAVGELLMRHGREIALGLLVAAGLFFLARGVARLVS